jgi:acetyl esterase/lipase
MISTTHFPWLKSSTGSRANKARVWALALVLSATAPPIVAADTEILLWPAGAPGSLSGSPPETVRLNERGEHIVSNVHAPSITPYLPNRSQSLSPGIIVIPGGGHRELWMDHEGGNVAEFLAAHGVAAFVLKYRLAHAPDSTYTVLEHALPDVQRAIRLVKSRASAWHLDPERIGVMGFSAGGELAALAAARYEQGQSASADPIDRMSSRPRFQALLYPSIPPDLTPSRDTPPAFLLCGADDQPAISQGLAELYLSMRRAGASAELHIYNGVGHGFGMRLGNTGPVAQWPYRFLEWLDQQRQGQ